MLGWILSLFSLAVIAAVVAFGGMAGKAAGTAKAYFLIFMVVFFASVVADLTKHRVRPDASGGKISGFVK